MTGVNRHPTTFPPRLLSGVSPRIGTRPIQGPGTMGTGAELAASLVTLEALYLHPIQREMKEKKSSKSPVLQ